MPRLHGIREGAGSAGLRVRLRSRRLPTQIKLKDNRAVV